jgi:hypothetical protein
MAQTRGQVIAIANTRGGVGKSTLAGNLTYALATQTSHRRPALRPHTVHDRPRPTPAATQAAAGI